MTDINKAIERLEGELIPAVSIDEADDIRTIISAVRQYAEKCGDIVAEPLDTRLLRQGEQLRTARELLEQIVCVKEPDQGVVLLSGESTSSRVECGGIGLYCYDNKYFSPLGDAMIDLYKQLGGSVE